MNKDLFAKLNKTSLKGEILTKSTSFGIKDYAPTEIPFFNLALSGFLDGGVNHGLTLFAAPSKHFKSSFLLIAMAAWQKKHPKGIAVFYDSESGSDITYFRNFGVNTDSVVYVPISNVEELKVDMTQKLDAIKTGDEVSFWIDSVGNLPSKKEIDDAIKGSDKADMTRAKALKSFGRIITPQINAKKIPTYAVNHVYDTQELYSKQIMSGGTGLMLSANNVIFIGRSQNKESDELVGYNFNIIIEKSRTIKERSKFPITVDFDGGIYKWSSVFEHALKFGFIKPGKKGWYVYKENNCRKAQLMKDENIMAEIAKDPNFKLLVEGSYTLDAELRLKAKELAKSRNLDLEKDIEEDSESSDLEEMFEEE